MNHIKCPSRGSWVRTLLLIFNRVIVSLLLVNFLKSLPKSSFESFPFVNPDNLPLRVLIIFAPWIGFSALMGVWSHLISVFKGETKLWKVQTKSVVEAVDTLKVSFWSDLIVVVFGLFFLFTLNSAFKLNEKDSKVLLGLTILLVPVVWLFITPCLYERVLNKRKPKTQSRTKPAKKPAPKVVYWYVFRSGKAEGPYTTLQLLLTQGITARTKVRQGKAKWQRAGEFSELAEYLSEK